ncbi:MAG: sulfotransferase [Candidatus Nanopelagicales bacterium]|nr:sulfotransferase [Candidatus Nanopelagicales bacterium]MCF8537520.1 sulfotransferase [Candidatus Nanopelagicales bacterium]MCF8542298.1 sulfotransferase [Candidatus Nanopelagicales bacterium]MCF8555974.1 sulfotransferase [Candidatus Nanopelagicales bacterium]
MPAVTNPVLIGGTGRSGSTILGRILARHPDLYLTDPEEVRFLANNPGMATALGMKNAGFPRSLRARNLAQKAIKRSQGAYFKRPNNSGLQKWLTKEEMVALGDRYLERFGREPLAATQEFTYAVMDKVAAPAEGRRWVDGTPANARVTDLIEPIYPDCQVVAIIRDGRDVAASFVEQTFGPNEILESLREWGRRSLRMHQAVQRCRPGRILTVDMLDMVQNAREESLEQVCSFLNIPLDPGMMEWFADNVSVDRAHVGRWRTQFDGETTEKINALYASIVADLRSKGVRIPLET